METRAVIAVLEGLARILDHEGHVLLTSASARRWPAEALETLEELGLLEPAGYVREMICDECEAACLVMPEVVQSRERVESLEVACQKHNLLLDFPVKRLLKRRLSVECLAAWLSTQLGLKRRTKELHPRLWVLGDHIARGERRSCYLSWNLVGATLPQALLEQVQVEKACVVIPRAEGPTARHWAEYGVTTLPLEGYLQGCRSGLRLHAEAVRLVTGVSSPERKSRLALQPGTQWAEVAIRILSDQRAQVVAGPIQTILNFEEFGMADRRGSPPTPNRAWVLLELLAEHRGEIRPAHTAHFARLRQTIDTLRLALQETCGLGGDPFSSYRSTGGWKTLFLISDWRDHPAL